MALRNFDSYQKDVWCLSFSVSLEVLAITNCSWFLSFELAMSDDLRALCISFHHSPQIVVRLSWSDWWWAMRTLAHMCHHCFQGGKSVTCLWSLIWKEDARGLIWFHHYFSSIVDVVYNLKHKSATDDVRKRFTRRKMIQWSKFHCANDLIPDWTLERWGRSMTGDGMF